MTRPTFNGIRLPEGEYLKDQPNMTLNQMLGEDGKPKYTVSQMKKIKKADLLAELIPLFEAAEAAMKPTPKPQAGGAKHKESKNKASAQSKKCHTIRKLATGIITLEQAMEIYNMDTVLQKVCTIKELEYAYENKSRPGNKRGVTKINIDDYDDNGDYIVARASGIYAEGDK